jgi:hypothetical protein
MRRGFARVEGFVRASRQRFRQPKRRPIMRMHLSSALAGLVLLGGIGAAVAQDVVIAPEQETVIREYVKKQPLASVNLPGVELNIGSTVPETVELQTLDVPDVQYRYVVVDGRTVLVEPQSRKIVHILN